MTEIATVGLSGQFLAESGWLPALRHAREMMFDVLHHAGYEVEADGRIVWRLRPTPRVFDGIELLALYGDRRVEEGQTVRAWRRDVLAIRARPHRRERHPLTPPR